MNKRDNDSVYLKFVLSHLLLSSLMFVVWWLIAGIDNAREMVFLISTLASCLAGRKLISEITRRRHR